jgi:hypothetical protein
VNLGEKFTAIRTCIKRWLQPKAKTVFAAAEYQDPDSGSFGLAGPLELRVEVRIVGVGLFPRVGVGLGRHQADRWVIEPLFVGVLVGFDWAVRFSGLSTCHQQPPGDVVYLLSGEGGNIAVSHFR